MQTRGTGAKPIFDMSKVVPRKQSELDKNLWLIGDLTQAQLGSPAWNGTAFKAARRQAEITQAEVAERTGLTQERISQIENGAKMTEETGTLLWNALFAINYEKGEKKIKEARDWAAGKSSATPLLPMGFIGMGGWLPESEKEVMEKLIAGQATVIESLKTQLAIHEKQSNWQPVLIELTEETKRQKEIIDMLVDLLNVETVKGLASKEAEELREEIANRFGQRLKSSSTPT